MSKEKSTRVTIDFPESLYNELTKLSEEMHVSKAEAIRKALRIAKLLFEEQEKGANILIEGNNSSTAIKFI
ncbi:MAG: ribbon-helix-helix domain-containing protein [Spirochaetes bacterium]|nr:ribbon-helix-helix domain-containing protein [Spirochaetota bacterium]